MGDVKILTPEDARAAVESARAAAEAERDRLIGAVKDALGGALEATITRVVTKDQAEVTTGIGPADLAVLKANLANAVLTAQASVPAALEGLLDIDKLLSTVKNMVVGDPKVKIDAEVAALSGSVHALLRKAGYAFPRRFWDDEPKAFSIADLGLNFTKDTKAFDSSVTALHKALNDVKRADHHVAGQDAVSLWEQV